MTSTMEHKPSLSSSWAREEQDFNLRDWALKGRIISRENTKSRRFSASNIKSFREETSSFRSNVQISSTASSPGYSLKEEIDPSTYSFTTALRALQVRSGYVWDCLSPDGFALNSKWNEAEKYICNPVSGEVPMECLSSKTLSGRPNIPTKKTRITVSGPLVYSSSHTSIVQSKPILITQDEKEVIKSPIKEEIKLENSLSTKRDVGTQSTPTDLSSSSSPISPTSTPSIKERSLKKRCDEVLLQSEESPNSGSNKSKTDIEVVQIEGKQKTSEEEEVTKPRNNKKNKNDKKDKSNLKQEKNKWKCNRGSQLKHNHHHHHQQQGKFRCSGTCLPSWRRFLWIKKRDKHRKNSTNIN